MKNNMYMKKILVIGSSNTDMTVKSSHLPAPGETVMGDRFVMGPGGKGANQAVAAARLGGDVTFICKVGRDVFGEKAIEGYRKDNIDTQHIMLSDQPSGVALILVDGGGENSISVAPGANGDLTPADIESKADIIRSADILILQLEIPMESVEKAVSIAKEAGVYVILNPAPAKRLPVGLLENVSLLTPNQSELEILTGIKGDVRAGLDALVERGVGEVILTLGSRGSMVYSGDEPVLIPALKVDAVDTTAAGDTFCGALAVAISEVKSLTDAARFATCASALTVQKMGAQVSIPYRKDMKY